MCIYIYVYLYIYIYAYIYKYIYIYMYIYIYVYDCDFIHIYIYMYIYIFCVHVCKTILDVCGYVYVLDCTSCSLYMYIPCLVSLHNMKPDTVMDRMTMEQLCPKLRSLKAHWWRVSIYQLLPQLNQIVFVSMVSWNLAQEIFVNCFRIWRPGMVVNNTRCKCDVKLCVQL